MRKLVTIALIAFLPALILLITRGWLWALIWLFSLGAVLVLSVNLKNITLRMWFFGSLAGALLFSSLSIAMSYDFLLFTPGWSLGPLEHLRIDLIALGMGVSLISILGWSLFHLASEFVGLLRESEHSPTFTEFAIWLLVGRPLVIPSFRREAPTIARSRSPSAARRTFASEAISFEPRFGDREEHEVPSRVEPRIIGEDIGEERRERREARISGIEVRTAERQEDKRGSMAPRVQREQSTLQLVPIIGRVAAGVPLLATENVKDHVVATQISIGGTPFALLALGRDPGAEVKFHPGVAYFSLEVKGESMSRMDIHTGDYVLVKRQDTANPGDVIAARIGDDATLKRYYPEKGHIRLQPENADEPVIIVVGDREAEETIHKYYAPSAIQARVLDESDFQILGKVLAVLKKIAP